MTRGDFEHAIDTHGLRFGALLFVLLFGVGVGGYWGATTVGHGFAASLATMVYEAPTPVTLGAGVAYSSTTPERIIEVLTIPQAVPENGRFIVADLTSMAVSLYQDGHMVASYPILTKGRPGSPYETPSGFYSILSKEIDHFNRGAQVHLPYAMQFYGNYFIHGWPYYADGTPAALDYSGGCIRLATADARQVLDFAERGTGMFVYDAKQATSTPTIALGPLAVPIVSTGSYLVADLDSRDVYAEQRALEVVPIASVTKLMTALVASETIMFDKEIPVPEGILEHPENPAHTTARRFPVGKLLYPLLMESNNAVADELASYYGERGFIGWMNSTADSLGMSSTQFADPSGISPGNVSTPEDLYRLAAYLTNKKSFIWKISRTPATTLQAEGGASYTFANFNVFSGLDTFIGGKVGQTGPAKETMVSVFSIPVAGQTHRIAIIVLQSEDYTSDTGKLKEWFALASAAGTQAACATCALPQYRKIPL